jgi:hypothetical protein
MSNTVTEPRSYLSEAAETYAPLTSIVDRLGVLKAQIADLTAEERSLKDALISRGEGTYEGDLYRAAVSSASRDVLDMEAVREKLSPQFIRAHTSVKRYAVVRVSARVRKS